MPPLMLWLRYAADAACMLPYAAATLCYTIRRAAAYDATQFRCCLTRHATMPLDCCDDGIMAADACCRLRRDMLRRHATMLMLIR